MRTSAFQEGRELSNDPEVADAGGAGVTVRVGDWTMLGDPASAVRRAVFIEEQGIPADLEMDARDAGAVHAVAFDATGRAVGTGRLLRDAHIGRMAVLKESRGRGIGAMILRALVARAHADGVPVLRLNAQVSALDFYVRNGFAAEGGQYLEAGIPHQAPPFGG